MFFFLSFTDNSNTTGPTTSVIIQNAVSCLAKILSGKMNHSENDGEFENREIFGEFENREILFEHGNELVASHLSIAV